MLLIDLAPQAFRALSMWCFAPFQTRQLFSENAEFDTARRPKGNRSTQHRIDLLT